jgi:CheY-like chemotaxis protein
VKILLVDDSKLDRLRVSECLDESGFEYVVAENGIAAWEIMQAPDAPTFALLDWVCLALTASNCVAAYAVWVRAATMSIP